MSLVTLPALLGLDADSQAPTFRYEDAPICLDLHLKDSYPHEPPLAHFHSWSRGLGKINPHLYEDGSVCLSLLNSEDLLVA